MAAAPAPVVPVAYQASPPTVPDWLNKGDNTWQMISAALVAMQGMPGLVILYAGLVKKKWALNSAFMALYAFAAVMPCWVLWAYKMSFGHRLLPFWGKAGLAVSQDFLIPRATLPSTRYVNGDFIAQAASPFYPMATMVFFQFAFAAVTVILLAGSVLGRMSIKAWMAFVPLWITFAYSIGAFSIWGGGFLFQWGIMDYSGGYVVHLASGAAGFTAAYWVRGISLCSYIYVYKYRLSYLSFSISVGGTEIAGRPGTIPTKQSSTGTGWCWYSLDGVDRFQWR